MPHLARTLSSLIMNAEIDNLEGMVEALQKQIGELKRRVETVEKAITVAEASDGGTDVTVACSSLVIRPHSGSQPVAMQLSSNAEGPFVSMFYPNGQAAPAAIRMAIDDGQPRIELRGRDDALRAELTIESDRGVTVMFGPGGEPGAVMRALPGGGSLAVVQPDGKPRGVLMHADGPTKGVETHGVPTELIFASAEGKTVLKLRADDGGGIVSVGPPGQADAAALIARETGPALLLHSPGATSSVSIIAGDTAEVCVHQGKFAGGSAQAMLTVGEFSSSLTLCKSDGVKAFEASAYDMATIVTLNDANELPCATLSHHFGSHSTLSLHSAAANEGFRALASTEVSSVEVKAPENPETKIVSAVHVEKPVMFLQKKGRALVMFGEGEQGGVVSTYGPDSMHAGIATLSGGPYTGALVMAAMDGTPQLTIDGTDHGGRLMINNDLGFQRIAMGVYEESAGIHLNHTGQLGVQAVATQRGGVVTVRDAEGHILACLPDASPEGGAKDWGASSRGF